MINNLWTFRDYPKLEILLISNVWQLLWRMWCDTLMIDSLSCSCSLIVLASLHQSHYHTKMLFDLYHYVLWFIYFYHYVIFIIIVSANDRSKTIKRMMLPEAARLKSNTTLIASSHTIKQMTGRSVNLQELSYMHLDDGSGKQLLPWTATIPHDSLMINVPKRCFWCTNTAAWYLLAGH